MKELSDKNHIYNVVSNYPLKVIVENDGDYVEEISDEDSEFHLEFGILFCPRLVSTINENNEEVKVYTIDTDTDFENPSGICIDIFTRLFEKLKEKDLVQEYNLELECNIDAFHHDYKILERLNITISVTQFGIGFYLGSIPKTREVNEEELNYMIKVQKILFELKNEFPILEKEEFELKYNLHCQFRNQ